LTPHRPKPSQPKSELNGKPPAETGAIGIAAIETDVAAVEGAGGDAAVEAQAAASLNPSFTLQARKPRKLSPRPNRLLSITEMRRGKTNFPYSPVNR